MKFLLEDTIPKGELEKCPQVRDVFSVLKKRCLIREHNLEALEDLFNHMNLYKLTEKVQEFGAITSQGAVKNIPKEQLYGENRTLPGNVQLHFPEVVGGRVGVNFTTAGGGTCLKLNCQFFRKRGWKFVGFLSPQTCRLEDQNRVSKFSIKANVWKRTS